MSLEFEVIGPYKIVRVLGQGGMGTVYHGIHAKSHDSVAIKVIAASMAQHQRFRRRFDAEIQTLLKLKHPGIVQLIGFGEEKGLLFYSMEYVDGENLQQQLRREKKLRWDRVVDIAIEICSALKHAHDFGVIHRDLKPANLLINSQGKVKLTDFGIAKLFGSIDATVEGSVLGTADYMPPEQAEGKPVTVRSDLYSLGSICYAAIAGRPPFTGKNIPEILFNVRYGSLTPLSALEPEVPKELCDLIDELLRREPSKRPPTGLVVGNRFQALRAGLARRAREKEAGVTEVRHLREMTSIDMNEDESLLSEVKLISPNEKDNAASTEPGQAGGLGKTSDSGPSVAGPEDNTRVAGAGSQSVFEVHDHPSGIEHMGKTKFTEVQEDDRRRSAIVISDPEPMSTMAQWISIGSLIGLLLACACVIIWFAQPPSANTLYRDIAAAIDSNEDEELLSIEPTAERFKELYPTDPRMLDVEGLLGEIDSVRSIRQMQRKANRGGSDQLDAVEQAFLECIKAQAIDSELAKRKFAALATVFAGAEKLTNRQRQIVALAKRMAEKLPKEGKPVQHPAVESLREQMSWADANLNASTRAVWLKGVVELFEDKVWARELVASAKSKLTAIENSTK